MRKYFFGWFLQFLEKHPQKIVNKVQLMLLLRCTSKGFGVKPRGKAQKILFSGDALLEYAVVSKELMKNYRGEEDRLRLFQTAYTLGTRIRKITGFTDSDQLTRLVFLLYRNIGITMTGTIPGELLIHRCAFAEVYSPTECSRMSAMDSGVIAGIFGGGALEFSERLTDGCANCKACFKLEDCEGIVK